MTETLEALYLFLPAFVANGMPIIARKIPGLNKWNTPISAALFGKNKTYRGFAAGVLSAVLVAVIQYAVRDMVPVLPAVRLHTTLDQSMLVGLLLGFGALGGDLVKSFAKRRVGIAPGNPWPVLDGIDYVIGAIVCLLPLYVPSPVHVIALIIAAPILSLAANCLSYVWGWKEVWY
jgi:CDP-2,3-bis-(O-geranylgeranyl)-sn-glycerol synthase